MKIRSPAKWQKRYMPNVSEAGRTVEAAGFRNMKYPGACSIIEPTKRDTFTQER